MVLHVTTKQMRRVYLEFDTERLCCRFMLCWLRRFWIWSCRESIGLTLDYSLDYFLSLKQSGWLSWILWFWRSCRTDRPRALSTRLHFLSEIWYSESPLSIIYAGIPWYFWVAFLSLDCWCAYDTVLANEGISISCYLDPAGSLVMSLRNRSQVPFLSFWTAFGRL